jgi:hypothetical protein
VFCRRNAILLDVFQQALSLKLSAQIEFALNLRRTSVKRGKLLYQCSARRLGATTSEGNTARMAPASVSNSAIALESKIRAMNIKDRFKAFWLKRALPQESNIGFSELREFAKRWRPCQARPPAF